MKPTNTSAKGARLEREIAKALVAKGWSVVRGAGSKSYGLGKIDLIAIEPTRKLIYILQCKNFKKGGLKAGESQRSELWQIFNKDFEMKSYTLKCELMTSLNDIELIG